MKKNQLESDSIKEITIYDDEKHLRKEITDNLSNNYQVGRGFTASDLLPSGIALKRDEIIFMQSEDIGNDYHFYEDSSYESLKKSFTSQMNVGGGYRGHGVNFSTSIEGKMLDYTETEKSAYTGVVSYTYKYGSYSLGGFEFANDDIKSLFYKNQNKFKEKYGDSYLKSVDVGIKAYIIIRFSSSSNYDTESSEWKAACKIAIKNLFGGKVKIDISGSTAKSEELAKNDCVISVSSFDNSEDIISPTTIDANAGALNEYLNTVIQKFDNKSKYKPLRRIFNRYPFVAYIPISKYLDKWYSLENGLLQVYDTKSLSSDDWDKCIEYMGIVNSAIATLCEKQLDGLRELPNPTPIESFINKIVVRKNLNIFLSKVDSKINITAMENSSIVIKSKKYNAVLRVNNYSLDIYNLPTGEYTVYPVEMPWKRYKFIIGSSNNNYQLNIKIDKQDMSLRALYLLGKLVINKI